MFKIIPVNELQVGMYVASTGLSWEEQPYLYSLSGHIESPDEIDAIREDGFKEVVIDTSKGLDVRGQNGATGETVAHVVGASPETPAPWPKPITEELGRARRIQVETQRFISDVSRNVRLGRPIDVAPAGQMISSMVDSVARNGDALLSLCKLRQADEYTYSHSLNVAVLAVYFGTQLQLSARRLHALGTAALFHDMGKMAIPERIIKKPGKLTDEEFGNIRRHPSLGRDILARSGVGEDILDAVAQHHERASGKGYPKGLKADQICMAAKIIGLVDVYDALTSIRPYKDAMSPDRALSLMYTMRGDDFEPQLLERFIKGVGIFPLGGVVQLSDGRTGVVVATQPEQPLRPEVMVVRDAEGLPMSPQHLDLAREIGLDIRQCLDPVKAGVDPMPFLAKQ